MRTIIGLSLLALAGSVAAQQQRCAELVAVPAPARVVIDGSLGEWDLSGALDSAFDEALAPRYSARFAVMYDAAALYVGAHFVDDSPLANQHDPAVEIDRGWDGDCLQVRLNTNPRAPWPSRDSNDDSFCHVDLWCFGARREPVCKLDWGMDHHGATYLTGQAAGVTFRVDPDGQGYTLEARLPWALLKAKAAPRAGDQLAFTLQPLWSDATGWKQAANYYEVVSGRGFAFQTSRVWGRLRLSPTGRLQPAQRPRTAAQVRTPLTLKATAPDAQAVSISLGVFAADGTLVRTLPPLTGPQAALSVPWDGLDDDGRPLPVGDYTVKLLSHRGLGQRWVASLHNAGTPPWRTDDGKGAWGGDHGAPLAACADARQVYLGWELSEAGTAVIAVEPKLIDGAPRKQWGQHSVLEIGMVCEALAVEGDRLFAAQDGRRWGQREGGKNTAGVVLWEPQTGKPLNFPFGKRCLVVSEWEPGADERPNLVGIAVRGDRLWASLRREDKVVALNWRTGAREREYPVPRPGGLALDAAGRLVLVSAQSLARLDPASGTVTTLATGLADPHSVALDADGRAYVSDRGVAQQVKVFAPDGRLVRTIGKAGGRPAVGRYDAQGLYQPAGLTVDAEGKLWVTEQDHTPKRVSVWSREGALLADLLGPGAYAVEAVADPLRPSWINTHATLFELDYATGRHRTLATLARGTEGQIHPFGGMMGRALRFAHAQGRDYAVWPGHGIAIVYRIDADLVGRPVAAVGYLKDAPLYGLKPEMFPPDQRANFAKERFSALFRWTDRNGDTRIDPDELVSAKTSQVYHGYWGPWVEPDLTLWFPGARSGAWRLGVESWLPGGVPVYPAPSAQQPLFATRGECIHAMPAKQGTYVLERAGGNVQTAAGASWMAVSRYEPDGRRRWAYRRTWTDFALEAPLYKPGMVIGAMKFIGSARLDTGLELVAVNGYTGMFSLLSDEGLWVGELCHDNRYGPKADATTVWPENFSGWFFRHRENGKVYLLAGDTDARIWEVTGLETIRTASAPLTLSAADYALAAAAAASRETLSSSKPPLPLVRQTGIRVDGDLGEWPAQRLRAVDAGDQRGFRGALASDDQHLYCAFDVADASPWVNAGRDVGLLFKTGDAVEVMLGLDPAAAAQRARPVAGDQRLLFALLEGKPVAVVLQPVTPAGLPPAPRLFSSPTGAEPFARVALVADAQVAVVRGATGYRLEAAVPWRELGGRPPAGAKLRGDLGVIWSDAGGSRNVFRCALFNTDTAITNDLPSEARLQPAGWGVLEVE
jgi:sugar lactone lactonase YvrE